MELRKYINTYIIGLIGSILLILSEFFAWFSDYSLIEIFVITTDLAFEDSFLFIFPLLSGVICLIASTLIIFKYKLKVKAVIICIVGLGFLIIFFIEYITQEIEYLFSANIGFYFGIVGFLLIVINLINSLITIEKQSEANK